ncbi:MAG: GNAT family N-acetyltransferase [Dehalococcoidia bacterium]|nr:MAG: GNAT family N-acetyltransferase [Dehalococcoidia bacterium]
MGYNSTGRETFASFEGYWHDASLNLDWSSVFVLPPWLRVWWQVFGEGNELYLRSFRDDKGLLGLAPLRIKDKTAYLVGSADVCDYLDFITVPGQESLFYDALLSELEKDGIGRLELESLRPETSAIHYLAAIARERGFRVATTRENVSLEMALPETWGEYLTTLTPKQRHEARRKLRRLNEAGQVNYKCEENPPEINLAMDTFLRLFGLSRAEKASFMTPAKETFFRSIADETAKNGILRLGTLEFDGEAAAMIMAFDYDDTVYLYNSGYDPRFENLSVGIASKLLCIKEAVARGKQKWDFLKGGEQYKYHLGGHEVPVYRCQIIKT